MSNLKALPVMKQLVMASTRIPQLRSTESARRNPSAAKSMGFCLWADIDQRCFEGMLSLIATTCESAKWLWNFTVGRLRCSRIAPRFRHFRF